MRPMRCSIRHFQLGSQVCKKQRFPLAQYCRCRKILRGMKKRDLAASDRQNLHCTKEQVCLSGSRVPGRRCVGAVRGSVKCCQV